MLAEHKTDVPYDPSSTPSFIIAEYNALKEEILKRSELQYQIMSLSLIVFGTVLSFGLQQKSSSIVLIYPILAVFLAIAWASNDRKIRELGRYIKAHIEAKVGINAMGWEHFKATTLPKKTTSNSLTFLSARGIFIGTTILSIVIALPLTNLTATEIVLLASAIASIIASIVVLRRIDI